MRDSIGSTRFILSFAHTWSQECWVTDLLADRDYKIRADSSSDRRQTAVVNLLVCHTNTALNSWKLLLSEVRETCTDPLANSEFFVRQGLHRMCLEGVIVIRLLHHELAAGTKSAPH